MEGASSESAGIEGERVFEAASRKNVEMLRREGEG